MEGELLFGAFAVSKDGLLAVANHSLFFVLFAGDLVGVITKSEGEFLLGKEGFQDI
jgi:hypothetical protein